MEKTMIIGCSDCGKTTLSREPEEELKLPLIHLDKIIFPDNRQTLSKDEFDKTLISEMEKPQWILDGNY